MAFELPTDNNELAAVIEDDIRKEFRAERALEAQRVEMAAREAQLYRATNGKGKHFKHVLEVPMRDWFRLIDKYGHEAVHSRDFLKYMGKKIPQLKTANV